MYICIYIYKKMLIFFTEQFKKVCLPILDGFGVLGWTRSGDEIPSTILLL